MIFDKLATAATGIFGSRTGRIVERHKKTVESVNAFEPELKALSDEALKAKTAYFKDELAKGALPEDILPEAFAAVREAARRTIGERHFDVQLIGGMLMHEGMIAEMRTGEGKTLVATLPAYLNALSGKGVHVVTVNDYLSRRDSAWMGQIYDALGLSVGVLNHEASYIFDATHTNEAMKAKEAETGSYQVVHDFLKPASRGQAYAADITYGTNNEFGFDFLRDNLEYEPARIRQKEHHFAIVDEIDSILIDEARTPLIISAPSAESEDLYAKFAIMVRNFHEAKENEDGTVGEGDYLVDEKLKTISLTDKGIEKAEKILGVDNLYTVGGVNLVRHLETAVRAKALFVRDKEYVVKDDTITIVDEFTGRLQPGRRWSEGLHQAIEAKEGVKVQRETRTFASITFQNYFRMYKKVAGMTGTAETSAEEFFKVYGLEVVPVPTHRTVMRKDLNDFIFQTEKGKWKAIAKKVKELNVAGQPVLIGTVSIERNELLSAYLMREGVPHQVLNAKNHEKEGEIIAQAGRKGAVTIATNMAGRGVDIKLGGVPMDPALYEETKKLGGLFVLGTERHEARRIDNQLRGRAGRQGDPGATQFFVSLEDDLMRVFASDTVKGLMARLNIPEDEAIQNSIVSRALETAQSKIEGVHFDSRKHILDYDDVLNQQRTSIYKRRRSILLGENVPEVFEETVAGATEEQRKLIDEKRARMGDEAFFFGVRRILLQTIDMFWVDHLEDMEYLRNSVNLRAYGQRDPLVEYKKEGLRLFRGMSAAVNSSIIELIPRLIEPQQASVQAGGAASAGTAGAQGAIEKAARNITMQGGSQNTGEQRVSGRTSTNGGANALRDNALAISAQLEASDEKLGRNDKVILVKDGVEKEVKVKKADALLAEGWQVKK